MTQEIDPPRKPMLLTLVQAWRCWFHYVDVGLWLKLQANIGPRELQMRYNEEILDKIAGSPLIQSLYDSWQEATSEGFR